MKRKPIVIVLIVALPVASILILGLVASVIYVQYGHANERMVWDLRKGPHDISEVNWPPSVAGRDWDQKGNFDLTIIGSRGNIIFHQRVQHIICRRSGTTLEDTFVHFGAGSTADEAYQIAKQILKDWHYDAEAMAALETWHDAISKRMGVAQFIALHRHDRDKYGTIALYPSFDVGVRLSETSGGGTPEKGDVSYTISLSF